MSLRVRFSRLGRLWGLLAVCATAGLVASVVLNGTGSAGASQAPPHKAAKVFLRRFHVLRLGHSAAHALPSVTSGWLATADQRYGLDTNDVASVASATGVTLWLIPGSKGACEVVQFPEPGRIVTGCGVTDSSGLGYALVNKSPSSGQTLVGFVPNGNSSVAVRLSDGTTTQAPVTDNALVYKVPAGESIQALSGFDMAGQRTTADLSGN